jgi:acetylxylan esterase
MNRYQNHFLAVVFICLGLLVATPARAASLQKVDQSVWAISGLPSYVNMYIYIPDKLAAKPAILVASHHCQGTGTGTYNETKSTLVPLADKNGFIMIFPEATGHNCWDVGSDKSLKHDGFGDTHAIAQMVRYTLAKYNGDSGRVYAFGGSSGAMMTQALMGVYPDIFMGGVAISGVPCGCWAEQYSGDVGTNGQWSGPCAGGTVTKTGQQWGDLVRSMYPGYTGHRPRLQLWHGNPDPTINYNNLGEAIKEWTDLLSLSTTPTATDTATANTTHQTWNNSCGYTVLSTFSIKGAGHGVQWDTPTVAGFLGLDKASSMDPETVACPGAVPGGSGGDDGTGGSGGTTDAGGVAGVAGKGGGAAGRADAGPAGTGGGVGSAASTKSGSSGYGGAVRTGGNLGSGGSSAQSGSGGAGSGGVNGQGGNSATFGSTPAPESSSGCGCAIGNHVAGLGARATALLLVALGLLLLRSRRA